VIVVFFCQVGPMSLVSFQLESLDSPGSPFTGVYIKESLGRRKSRLPNLRNPSLLFLFASKLTSCSEYAQSKLTTNRF
jgi:hypothetical protein